MSVPQERPLRSCPAYVLGSPCHGTLTEIGPNSRLNADLFAWPYQPVTDALVRVAGGHR